MSQAPEIKGAAVRQFVLWYADARGLERRAAIIGRLPVEMQRHFELDKKNFGIIDSIWYPSAVFHALLDLTLAELTAAQKDEMARGAARMVMDSTVRGIYKLLFDTMMTPERYARNSQKLFSRYYRPGTMTKVVQAPNRHETRIEEWSGHHPFLCEMLLYTGEYVYTRMGCQEVTHRRTACVSDGAKLCSFVIAWK